MRVPIIALSIPTVLLALAPLFADTAPSAQDLRRANRLTAKGDRALKAGNLGKALESYQRALEIVPDLPEGHVGRGHVLMRHKKFQAAHDAFTHAVHCYNEMGDDLFQLRQERYSDAQVGADQIRVRISNTEQTISRMQSGLDALMSDSSPAAQREAANLRVAIRSQQSELAMLNQQLQRLERIDAPKISDIDSVPGEVYFFIGNALLNLDRTDEAIAAWETCARKSPSFALVHNNLAVGYWKQDRLEQARESLERAEQLGFRVNPNFKADLTRSLAGKFLQPTSAP